MMSDESTSFPLGKMKDIHGLVNGRLHNELENLTINGNFQ